MLDQCLLLHIFLLWSYNEGALSSKASHPAVYWRAQPHPKGSLDFALVSWELLSKPLGCFLWKGWLKVSKVDTEKSAFVFVGVLGQPDRDANSVI